MQYVDPYLAVTPPDTTRAIDTKRLTDDSWFGPLERPVFNPYAPYMPAAPDTVLAALRRAVADDPSPTVQWVAARLGTELGGVVRRPEWKALDQARRSDLSARAVGCYQLILDPWRVDTLPTFARRVALPAFVVLLDEPARADSVYGARSVGPAMPGARAAWWVVGPDSVAVRWAAGEATLTFRGAVMPDRLRGRALAGDGPRGSAVTTGVAWRRKCGTGA